MCEQDYENTKLVITKFSFFLQTLNSNFRLSANRALLFSYLTITDVTSYVHHKLPVSFLLYIATKKTCQINQISTVNSSMNAPISETYSSQKNNSCTPCVPMFMSVVKGFVHWELGIHINVPVAILFPTDDWNWLLDLQSNVQLY